MALSIGHATMIHKPRVLRTRAKQTCKLAAEKKYSETYDELYRAIVDGDVMEKTVETIFGGRKEPHESMDLVLFGVISILTV